mmetsp:Transcript_18991/g.26719  ORF Transcript_18991/g.26719 Transcript_18991/m.26719 type:complete len:131 (-) Transcript_18991:466-858(-)
MQVSAPDKRAAKCSSSSTSRSSSSSSSSSANKSQQCTQNNHTHSHRLGCAFTSEQQQLRRQSGFVFSISSVLSAALFHPMAYLDCLLSVFHLGRVAFRMSIPQRIAAVIRDVTKPSARASPSRATSSSAI